MKKVISLLLLLAMALTLAACADKNVTVKFVADGAVVENYCGATDNMKFPTPAQKDNMNFVGWFTEEVGGVQVTLENIDEHLNGAKELILYAVYEAEEDNSNNESNGEDQGTTKPDGGVMDENIDTGGWT